MLEQRPFISIIIPHFNDPERLAKCLKQLENQTYPSQSYEIIVVDNGSEVLPESIVSQFPHSQLVVETKTGSYAARNKGLSVAKGEIIAFTDADCLPHLDWLERGKDALLQHDNIGLVAGRVSLFAADPEAPTVPEIYEQLYAFPIENYVRFWHFGPTANLFTRKKTFDDLGMFNDVFKSGGDLEWGRRVHAAGYEIFYGKDVVVDHPARNNAYAIYQKERRVHGGSHDILVQHSIPIKYLWQDFPIDILPPIRRSREILLKNCYPMSTRLKLIIIDWICNYIAVLERLRLLFGGRSKRQ